MKKQVKGFLILLGAMTLSIAAGMLVRFISGAPRNAHIVDELALDGLVGLAVIVVCFALYYPVYFYRNYQFHKASKKGAAN